MLEGVVGGRHWGKGERAAPGQCAAFADAGQLQRVVWVELESVGRGKQLGIRVRVVEGR